MTDDAGGETVGRPVVIRLRSADLRRVTLLLKALSIFAGMALFAGPAWGQAGSTLRAGTAETTVGWQALTHTPAFNPGAMFLLTDGTVMVQDMGFTAVGSSNWWRLTPDASGSYVDGSWSEAASMPDGYAPHAYAAAVLPDGRLVVAGGEYDGGVEIYSNRGAIYDPVANTWTMIAPPNGGVGLPWDRIADAPSVVLADGRFMVGVSGWTTSIGDAILDPSTLTWTTQPGTGKAIGNGEAGFSLLPSGKVLTVDADTTACTTRGAELYDPAVARWSSAGVTPTQLVTCSSKEIGPQILMYSGKVFVDGSTGASALYDVASGTWSSGPSLPIIGGEQFDAADGAAALLPDGSLLLDASPGVFQPPTHFFLYDGTSLTRVADGALSSLENSGNGFMLLLPTGQVLFSSAFGPSSIEIFTDDSGSPNPAWAPTVASVPTALARGGTYTIVGRQLNGLSEGSAFGDDYQASTDYPLVQITNESTGTVTYARTYGMTNRSIAPGAAECASFVLPAATDGGTSDLRVIANGIASTPVQVTVGSTGANTTSCTPTVS